MYVGLGNPGRRYEGTRHNVGYAILAELARRHGAGPPKAKFHGEVVEAELGGQKALLLEPHNLYEPQWNQRSGGDELFQAANRRPAGAVRRPELPVGKLRFRGRRIVGRAEGIGGHHREAGERRSFARLRVGIGAAPEGWDWADYVLSKFAPAELPAIDEAVRAGRRRRGWCGPARASSFA